MRNDECVMRNDELCDIHLILHSKSSMKLGHDKI
jgi:hypothetical protein